MTKYTLFLKQNLPFASCPRIVELEPEHILANDVQLPVDHPHPHNMRLWVLGNEFGAMGAVWADCAQHALNELIDAELGGGILIDEADADEDTDRAGNAGEPIETEHLWMGEVEWDNARDFVVLMRFAEARGMCHKNLDF